MAQVIYSDFQQLMLSGCMPFSRYGHVTTNAPILPHLLFPDDLDIARCYDTKDAVILYGHNRAYGAMIKHTVGTSVNVYVCSKDPVIGGLVYSDIMDRIPHVDPPEDEVNIRVCHLSSTGVSISVKSIKAPAWDEIAMNYPGTAHKSLAKMMGLRKPDKSGKVILWHGPPGTGKTWAIRALARAWKSWASFSYITDPEQMFQNPSYLMEEAGGNRDDEKWKLMIAEDSDEYLRSTARHISGAALGRLLNFSDGILGQGSNTLILLTTNEKITELHPALIRPGRCLAQIEFRAFSPTEATAWLGATTWLDDSACMVGHKTLAELIEYRDGTKQIVNGVSNHEKVGQYL